MIDFFCWCKQNHWVYKYIQLENEIISLALFKILADRDSDKHPFHFNTIKLLGRYLRPLEKRPFSMTSVLSFVIFFNGIVEWWFDFIPSLKFTIINEGVDSLVSKSLVEIADETVPSVTSSETEEHLVLEPIGNWSGRGRWLHGHENWEKLDEERIWECWLSKFLCLRWKFMTKMICETSWLLPIDKEIPHLKTLNFTL